MLKRLAFVAIIIFVAVQFLVTGAFNQAFGPVNVEPQNAVESFYGGTNVETLPNGMDKTLAIGIILSIFAVVFALCLVFGIWQNGKDKESNRRNSVPAMRRMPQ